MHALRFFQRNPFAAHKQRVHSGENEYRERVLFLMEQSGSRSITGQKKRIIVQNFAHFHKFSPEEPRCEAACVLCQRKDFIENRPAHEPGLKLVCGHRPLILLGRVG